jgi:hypothetical protein
MIVDLTPLLRGQRGETIEVARVRVGDAATSVDLSAVTGADDAYGCALPDTPIGRVRTTPDGSEVAVPLEERVAEVRERGGWLWCGEAVLRVKDGRIERIVVRGPWLGMLDIAQEDAIARRFGPPAGHEREMGCRLHHYPDRGLVVAWHGRKGRLEYVLLGEDTWQEPRLGARALLSELLDAFFVLSRAEWRVDRIDPDDETSRVRYQRIAALGRALGLGTVPELVHGKFLEGELSEGRRDLIVEVAAQRDEIEYPARSRAPAWLFQHLLDYRHHVDRVVRATAGWMMCSDGALLGMIATQNRIGRQLEPMMIDIDRWICTLIDPGDRVFPVSELIAEHGWPDVDLDGIGLEDC